MAGIWSIRHMRLDAVPDLSDLSQRDSIRHVVITLTTALEAPQRGLQTYELTSDVLLRNLE